MDRGAWWATDHAVSVRHNAAAKQQQKQDVTELGSDQGVLTLNPVNFVHWFKGVLREMTKIAVNIGKRHNQSSITLKN